MSLIGEEQKWNKITNMPITATSILIGRYFLADWKPAIYINFGFGWKF